MEIVPNELIININTSIPGYQKIKYKPSMTLKSISKDDDKIFFNPLIKISDSVINKIPEKFKKKQFFEKGLFESLLNFTNKKPLQSLDESTHEGVIDNNIKTTLNTIFPENSVIYIGGKPYVIADLQWSNGDWKIDTKKKKQEIDANKIEDPLLYQEIVEDEIIKGEEQLKSLNPGLIYGPSFSDSKTEPSVTGVTEPSELFISKKTPLLITRPEIEEHPEEDQKKDKIIKKIDPVIEPIDKINFSSDLSQFVRGIYREKNMYNLINKIYRIIPDESKKMLDKTNKTKIKKDENITIQDYNQQVDSITINTIPGDGNCFFKSVADGINYYNFYNQENRIISGIYGTGTNLFTQLSLRRIVYNFLQTWTHLDYYFENIAPENVDNMNLLFNQALNEKREILRNEGLPEEISNEEYVEIAQNTYIRNENFLVKNVTAVPIEIENYETPFKIIDRINLENYILSVNYWGGEVSIIALCETLRLNIIPITIDNTGRIYNSHNNFDNTYNNWNKYLFLYCNGNHFDLISFHLETRQLVTSITGKALKFKNILTTKTIFKKTQLPNELPPIYILFTIYGAFYSIMTEEGKRNFTYHGELMKVIDNAINVLHTMPEYENFYNSFKHYFTTSRIPVPIIEGGDKLKKNTHTPSDLHKTEDKSKLAYYISIDLELYPGTKIPDEEKKKLKCMQKWNNIRKAYAEFTGKKYIIQPVYPDEKTKKNKNNKNNTTKKKHTTKKK